MELILLGSVQTTVEGKKKLRRVGFYGSAQLFLPSQAGAHFLSQFIVLALWFRYQTCFD